MENIKILGTGLEFIRSGIRGIEPVIEELIENAKKEIHIMAYVFTPPAIYLLKLLEHKAEMGITIKLVINDVNSQGELIASSIRSLSSRFFPLVTVTDFADLTGKQLHAKVLVADRRRAVIGSANLTWRGMVHNYEIGVLVEGKAAWEMASIIDQFASRFGSSK
jgi:phosphatidylserine/phosphatidylglycerophosphate/cardiolipin synthase-like enzyme